MAVEDRDLKYQKMVNDAGIAQPKPMPAPKVEKPSYDWETLSGFIPAPDLVNLISAWSSGSSGVGALSPLRWRYLAAAIPGMSSATQIEAMLRGSWLKAGSPGFNGSGGRGRAPRAAIPETRQPFRRPQYGL
jgi:hypothetical protein